MSIESKADAIRPLKRRHTVDGISTKIYVLMDKWIVRLGLAHWAIKVRFDYSGDGYAEMVCEDPEYEVATIWVNVRRCRRELWTEAQYDSIILHELVHIINRIYGCDLEEIQVDSLGQGIFQVFAQLGIELDWSDIPVKEWNLP